jgi:hypothetical protein
MPVRHSVAVIALACALASTVGLAGCSSPAKPIAASIQDCGASRTAANVPVQIEVYRGQVSCSAALQVEASYARAIVSGQAPGNGGGGPVTVDGWTCQGMTTPQLLQTGEASKCSKDGHQNVAILKAPS